MTNKIERRRRTRKPALRASISPSIRVSSPGAAGGKRQGTRAAESYTRLQKSKTRLWVTKGYLVRLRFCTTRNNDDREKHELLQHHATSSRRTRGPCFSAILGVPGGPLEVKYLRLPGAAGRVRDFGIRLIASKRDFCKSLWPVKRPLSKYCVQHARQRISSGSINAQFLQT